MSLHNYFLTTPFAVCTSGIRYTQMSSRVFGVPDDPSVQDRVPVWSLVYDLEITVCLCSLHTPQCRNEFESWIVLPL